MTESTHELDCEKALTELYGYLDGALTPGRKSQIRGHLDTCMHCFEAYDFEEDLRQVVAHCCQEEAPSQLKARILAMLNQDPAPTAVPNDDT